MKTNLKKGDVMRKKLIAAALVLVFISLSGLSIAEENATYDFTTGVLEIPRVKTSSGDLNVGFQIAGPNNFLLTKADWIQSSNIGNEAINGTYKGIRTNFGTFNYAATDTIITINYNEILVDIDSFLNGECRLSGSILDDYSSASGIYQCSDFTSGTWSSQRITVDAEVLTAIIDFISGSGASYTSTAIGVKF